MKYAHIDENNQLLGWYDKDIHDVIPEPNIEVTDEQWQHALNEAHNRIYIDGKSDRYDFRTEYEKRIEFEELFRVERDDLLSKTDKEIFKLDDVGGDASQWRAYRQALRDATIDWVIPTPPE